MVCTPDSCAVNIHYALRMSYHLLPYPDSELNSYLMMNERVPLLHLLLSLLIAVVDWFSKTRKNRKIYFPVAVSNKYLHSMSVKHEYPAYWQMHQLQTRQSGFVHNSCILYITLQVLADEKDNNKNLSCCKLL